MKKLIYVTLLTLAFGLVSASRGAETPKASETPALESGSSSKTVAQADTKHKKKHHHHHKKDKKNKEAESPKT